MQIIEKIEIKHFRSFDGGTGQDKVEIYDLRDFNIFSGANDSGKSNILRALNLFFNNEIMPGVSFDLDRDLSKTLRKRSDEKVSTKRDQGMIDVRQKDLWVKIKIHFVKTGSSNVLPEKFWIEKRWDKNGLDQFYRHHNIKSESRTREGKITQFLNNIRFEYVPAIKDQQFFRYLFQKLQTFLFEKDKTFSVQSEKFNDILRKQTSDLFIEFKKNTEIEASFAIPETLLDFFRTLTVETSDGISLFDRGDGVQVRFIPDILNEISKNSKKKVIWGFEEPENSYESKNIRKLRDDFLNKYTNEKQVFITTHSGEFLSLDDPKVSIYRVYKTDSNLSQVVRFDEENNEWGNTCDDLGIILESRLIEKLQNTLIEQRRIIETSEISYQESRQVVSNMENKFNECLEKLDSVKSEIDFIKRPSVFFEDEHLEIYKIAWLKLKDIQCAQKDFRSLFEQHYPYSLHAKHGRICLYDFLDSPNIEEWRGRRVIGVFDFDEAYNDFNGLHSTRWGGQSGSVSTGLHRTRIDHMDFHAILLPVPSDRSGHASEKLKGSSLLEPELYFSDEILEQLGNREDYIVPGGNTISIFKGKKGGFWKKLFSLPKEEFKNFELLFSKIEDLMES